MQTNQQDSRNIWINWISCHWSK